MLPGGFDDTVIIPHTHKLLIASFTNFDQPDEFFSFDVDTQQLILLPFNSSANTGKSSDYIGYTLQISPNGQDISYQVEQAVPTGKAPIWYVVNFSTGQLIVSRNEDVDPIWQQDSQHLIGVRQVPNTPNYEIAQFDLAGHAVHLTDYSDGVFFVVRG